MVARTSPDSTASPTATLMVATVPSCGATTGISIFMASSTRTASPAFTAVPAAASIFADFTRYRSSNLYAACCACRSCCFRCCRCCFWCRCCFCCADNWSCACCGSFFYSYVIYISVYGNGVVFHWKKFSSLSSFAFSADRTCNISISGCRSHIFFIHGDCSCNNSLQLHIVCFRCCLFNNRCCDSLWCFLYRCCRCIFSSSCLPKCNQTKK